MKKFLALFLAMVMCLSFVACGENDTENAKDAEKASETKLKLNITSVGQEIMFGSYPKTSDGAYDDVQWIVLDIQGDKALLISKYAVEPKNSWDVSEFSDYMSRPGPCLPRGSLGPEMALSISTPVLFRV